MGTRRLMIFPGSTGTVRPNPKRTVMSMHILQSWTPSGNLSISNVLCFWVGRYEG